MALVRCIHCASLDRSVESPVHTSSFPTRTLVGCRSCTQASVLERHAHDGLSHVIVSTLGARSLCSSSFSSLIASQFQDIHQLHVQSLFWGCNPFFGWNPSCSPPTPSVAAPSPPPAPVVRPPPPKPPLPPAKGFSAGLGLTMGETVTHSWDTSAPLSREILSRVHRRVSLGIVRGQVQRGDRRHPGCGIARFFLEIKSASLSRALLNQLEKQVFQLHSFSSCIPYMDDQNVLRYLVQVHR